MKIKMDFYIGEEKLTKRTPMETSFVTELALQVCRKGQDFQQIVPEESVIQIEKNDIRVSSSPPTSHHKQNQIDPVGGSGSSSRLVQIVSSIISLQV